MVIEISQKLSMTVKKRKQHFIVKIVRSLKIANGLFAYINDQDTVQQTKFSSMSKNFKNDVIRRLFSEKKKKIIFKVRQFPSILSLLRVVYSFV